MDGRLDEDRDLHVVAGPVEHALSPLRLCQGDLADVLPGLEVLALLGRVERVDRDQVHVPTERRLAEDLDLHPPVAPRLDVGQGAADGVIGDVREAANRIAGVAAVGSDPTPSGIGVPHHGGAAKALLVRGNSDVAATGAASAPMGEISIEAINRIENKRSRAR